MEAPHAVESVPGPEAPETAHAGDSSFGNVGVVKTFDDDEYVPELPPPAAAGAGSEAATTCKRWQLKQSIFSTE